MLEGQFYTVGDNYPLIPFDPKNIDPLDATSVLPVLTEIAHKTTGDFRLIITVSLSTIP